MTNTALRAENSNSRTITFKSREHEKFYEEYLEKCRYQDVYHRALVYCLGIDRDTRNNVNAAPWMPTITLDNILERFNIDRPEDFRGHSLSVSDVIVINRGAKITAYYVDSFGFQELPEFVQQRMNMLEHNSVRA